MYDLPGWQALYDELHAEDLVVIGIALDQTAETVRPFTEAITFPVLLDREHLVTELLAISNVPTVVWVDERARIVRPNASEFGSNTFKEFTGVDCEAHHQLVRDWVRSGATPLSPDAARAAVADLNGDEIDARLHFRLATHLQRAGDDAAAARHFDRAIALAPLDFTIARAAMPLRGGNPFGEEFFALYERWQRAGSPYHGIARAPDGTKNGTNDEPRRSADA